MKTSTNKRRSENNTNKWSQRERERESERQRDEDSTRSQAAFITLVLISIFTHLDGEHLPDARGVFLESERDEAPYSPAEQAVVQKTQLRHRVPRRDKVRVRREARLLSPGEHVRAWLNIFEVSRLWRFPPTFFLRRKGKGGRMDVPLPPKIKKSVVQGSTCARRAEGRDPRLDGGGKTTTFSWTKNQHTRGR